MIAIRPPIAASDFTASSMATASTYGGSYHRDLVWAGPSITLRTLIAILGITMVIVGPCLFLFEPNNQVLTWVFAVLTTWMGMSLLLLLWLAGCRHPEVFETRPEEQSALTTAGSAIHLNPLMEILAELGRQTSSRSVALLSAEGAAWRLRMAWNCSQVYGSNIAQLLEGRVQSGTQSLQYLSLMDGTVSCFCTPIHLKSGSSMLLVLINAVNHTMLYNTPSLALQASMKIVGQLGNVRHSVPTGGRSGVAAASPRAVCCTVCDSLHTHDGRWIPWGDWLKENYETTREYTFCDNCSQWIYGLDASELRAA